MDKRARLTRLSILALLYCLEICLTRHVLSGGLLAGFRGRDFHILYLIPYTLNKRVVKHSPVILVDVANVVV